MRIYLDTNIYLDWLENRKDNLRPLGEFAFQIIKRTISCEFEIVISKLVIRELRKFIAEEQINNALQRLIQKKKLVFIDEEKGDFSEAKEMANKYQIPWQDALHAILAKRADSEFLVTRDAHLFNLYGFIKSVFPENI